jgi:uncharacterized membrane protein YkvA (DUF1232 family)
MANKKSDKLVVRPSGGVLRDFVLRLKLILRLMGDSRVSPFLKLLPIASLVYLISPVDLVSGIAFPIIGAVDDVAIVSLGAYLFIELCPADVVQEHMRQLTSNMDVVNGNDEIVDAETVEMDGEK